MIRNIPSSDIYNYEGPFKGFREHDMMIVESDSRFPPAILYERHLVLAYTTQYTNPPHTRQPNHPCLQPLSVPFYFYIEN